MGLLSKGGDLQPLLTRQKTTFLPDQMTIQKQVSFVFFCLRSPSQIPCLSLLFFGINSVWDLVGMILYLIKCR